ncbi:galactosylgalactosylxylosylprotein 3-beta-glucuronosyltransferase 3 [Dermacentor silvarum]|uniref:galactosylgalactosylxylosylprotein 3-beta-glucuronosyltransferase 3 n=1 Tax=Dermacentor silvarum TaxID=543639 RepID=UPI00210164A8|nr:galactosylgalactosylxylosylprotein 3-beta-glucuronosyltransferase 3 [Dermacentor silvarum]
MSRAVPSVPLPWLGCETGALEAIGARFFATGPTVYVVTPTYRRANQAPVLVRLSQTLMLAEARIFWLIVEDAKRPSALVEKILRRTGLAGVHLASRTPSKLRQIKRGKFVARHMKAIAWLRKNAVLPSVLYFTKEDNSYDHRLFAQRTQIAQVQRVGVLPVALSGAYNVSSPLVSPDGRVVGFHEPPEPERPFPMDLAGFAVNMRLVLSSASPNISFDSAQVATVFLESLGVTMDDLEPLASNCTETTWPLTLAAREDSAHEGVSHSGSPSGLTLAPATADLQQRARRPVMRPAWKKHEHQKGHEA